MTMFKCAGWLSTLGVAALVAGSTLANAAPGERGTTTFVVTNFDFQDYVIDGQPDPDLTLMRGERYVFDLQGIAAFHPLFIKAVQSTGSGNTYDNGVVGNGASGEDDIIFDVPFDAPVQLFYNCGNHSPMTGNIFIIDGPSIFANGFE